MIKKKKIVLPNGAVLEVTKEESFKLLRVITQLCQVFHEQKPSRFSCPTCLKLRKYKISSCRYHQVDRPPPKGDSTRNEVTSHKIHRNRKNVEDEENRYRGHYSIEGVSNV